LSLSVEFCLLQSFIFGLVGSSISKGSGSIESGRFHWLSRRQSSCGLAKVLIRQCPLGWQSRFWVKSSLRNQRHGFGKGSGKFESGLFVKSVGNVKVSASRGFYRSASLSKSFVSVNLAGSWLQLSYLLASQIWVLLKIEFVVQCCQDGCGSGS
jgi:hypothetical protein